MEDYVFDFCTNDSNDFLGELDQTLTTHLQKRGRLFAATPLLSFRTASELKNFRNQFSKKIASLEAENSKNVTYSTDIKFLESEVPDLAPIKICVKRTRNGEEKPYVIFNSIFFSWRTQTDEGTKGCLNLPFLYCIGQQQFITLVNNLMEERFSCSIVPVEFTQLKFKWLFVLIVHCIQPMDQNVHFVYEMPQVDMKLHIYISLRTLKELLWDNIHETNSTRINQEEVARMHTAMEEHIMHTYGYDLCHFNLKVFNIPGHATLDVSGKVHILKLEIVDLLCRFLNDMTDFE